LQAQKYIFLKDTANLPPKQKSVSFTTTLNCVEKAR